MVRWVARSTGAVGEVITSRAAHLLPLTKKKEMGIEEVRQELAKAEAEKQKAENELQAWKGRYGQRLTWLENKLWKEEGTETQQSRWETEKTRLEERQKSLEAEVVKSRDHVRMLQDRLTAPTQPGNDFVTRALGTRV